MKTLVFVYALYLSPRLLDFEDIFHPCDHEPGEIYCDYLIELVNAYDVTHINRV